MVQSVSLCLLQAFFMHFFMMESLYPLCLISDIIVLTPSSRPGSLLHLSKMILKKLVMQLIFVSGGPWEVVWIMLPLWEAFWYHFVRIVLFSILIWKSRNGNHSLAGGFSMVN